MVAGFPYCQACDIGVIALPLLIRTIWDRPLVAVCSGKAGHIRFSSGTLFGNHYFGRFAERLRQQALAMTVATGHSSVKEVYAPSRGVVSTRIEVGSSTRIQEVLLMPQAPNSIR